MSDTATDRPPGSVSDSPQTPNRQENATNTSSTSRQRRGKKQGHAASNSRSKPPPAGVESAISSQQQYLDDESQDSSQPGNSARHDKKGSAKPTPKPKQHRQSQPSTGIPDLDGTTSPRPNTASASQAIPSNGQTNNNTTPVKQAYAGPTFHASPAASALPMPKFMSKSVPYGSGSSGLQAQLEQDHDSEDFSESHTQGQTTKQRGDPIPPREESPLDFFFNAHRAEQAQQRSRNSPAQAHMARNSQSSLTPESADRQHYHTLPRPTSSSRRGLHRTASGQSGRDMFMMELDGAGEGDASDDSNVPAVSFRERIHAAATRSSSNLAHAQTPPQSSNGGDEDLRMQQSHALKRLLGHGADMQQPGQLAGSASHNDIASQPQNTPPHGQSSTVREMESNLRKMLKLDP